MHMLKRQTAFLLLASTAFHAATAQTAPGTRQASTSEDEETITLTPFEVSAERDTGYAATETLAGTRIRTNLADVGSPISVITRQMLQDIGATNTSTLLQYTTNAEVAGTRGTFAGLGNATTVDETQNLRAPNGAQRVRGLAAADMTRDFFVTDIPWDSYNVDRIEIQRGPNSILFGLGSPAGIVNATTRNADFRNTGNIEGRVGSYGSWRTSLDLNQELIDNVLAVRLDALYSDEKFQQEPAFQKDKRIYGALRFDPKLFARRDFHTSIKVKYEHGEIRANRPRIVPPIDAITPWFRPVDTTSLTGGMGKLTVNNGYEVGSNSAAFNPWLSASVANQQQPIWFEDGITNQHFRIYGGYVNTGARNNNGTVRGPGDSLLGQRYSEQFFGLAGLSAYANNARLPGFQYGQYRDMSLQDASVFDFYNKLIDGPTKKEWENWDAYNLDLSQTAFSDRLGVQLTYDKQKYDRGGQQLLGNPAITLDVLRNFQDLSPNPNFGRPYVVGGPGNGSSYESEREYIRGSLFGELRASDFFKSDFLVKLLGKQRFNGVYSDETYETEVRSWRLYAHSREWAGYWNRNDGSNVDFKDRSPVAVIYLGSSLANAASASGANISNIQVPVELQNGSLYYFDSTWRNPAGVSFGDPWTVPANLMPIFDPATATTQASNPANYTGWNTNFQMNLLRWDDGRNPSLLTNAQKTFRKTKSYAGSWQGFFWNDAIVPTLGWRYDEVKGKSVSAAPVPSNRLFLNMQPDAYRLPDQFPSNQIFKDHSTAGGVVVHMNKLLNDMLPINVSLSYNKSSNFQVTDTRRDVYGNAIGNPTGATKDYGVLLSTKDGKYSFRAVKYETKVTSANTPIDLSGLVGSITQGLKFRNVFLYRMSGYTWDTREQTNLTPGQRYFWTPAYINSAGRPVADLNGNPTPPAGAVLETQAQADAHRDASIRAWNDIQKWLDAKGFFRAWGYNPTTLSALTDRATYEATLVGRDPAPQYIPDTTNTLYNYGFTTPPGLQVTSDTESEGYEFELTANPLPNWRVSFNASQTEASRVNVGGPLLDELVSYMDQQMAGVAGDMRQFNGNYVPNNEVRQNWANWRGRYTLLKLQEGASASEIRKWRYNFVTNYSFTTGMLKGVGVGGSYRWQDKVVIGYPVIAGANNQANFDLSQPYYGPSEDAIDLWLSYERRLTEKIHWKIQLNVRNAFAEEGVIPISVQPDGRTWASVRVKPVQEWFVTNTLSF
jgi:hypothetical protein